MAWELPGNTESQAPASSGSAPPGVRLGELGVDSFPVVPIMLRLQLSLRTKETIYAGTALTNPQHSVQQVSKKKIEIKASLKKAASFTK